MACPLFARGDLVDEAGKLLAVTKAQLRQYLTSCQFLLGSAEASPEHILQTLECIQLDPVSLVDRNQNLVLQARTKHFSPGIFDEWLTNGQTVEYEANAASLMPMADFPILKGVQRRLYKSLEPELHQLGPVVDEVLRRLETEGPLTSRAFDSTHKVAGYWDNQSPNTKVTSHALNLLRDMGILRVVAREGNQRVFDLTWRGLPEAVRRRWETIPEAEADQLLLQKYLRAYRVIDVSDPRFGWRALTMAERWGQVSCLVSQDVLTPISVENAGRRYWILTSDLDRILAYSSSEPDIDAQPLRFLPPLDNLLWRRPRLQDLFEFSYTWEIYLPAAKRRYGPYVMPILAGSRLVGRIDAKRDNAQNQLSVSGIWWESWVSDSKHWRRFVLDQLGGWAKRLGLTSVAMPPHRE